MAGYYGGFPSPMGNEVGLIFYYEKNVKGLISFRPLWGMR